MSDQTRKSLKHMVWFIGIGASTVVWAMSTFATSKSVDETKQYFNQSLQDMRSDSRDTRNMVIDLYRDQFNREPILLKRGTQ